jgi:hypothetical protein
MTLQKPNSLPDLYQELVTAAKSLPWQASNSGIHHRNDRGAPDPDVDWYPKRESSLRVEIPSGEIYHLQIRLEQHGQLADSRVVIFGRRMKSFAHATPNTQRATFNSANADLTGFWLRPRLSPAEAESVSLCLPGPSFPRWANTHIELGSADPYPVLRRFLIALSAIENTKMENPPPFTPPFPLESPAPMAEFERDDLSAVQLYSEGQLAKVTVQKRRRCQRLLGEAQEHFRSQSKDGKLHCQICNWSAPLPTRGEIVQIHHHKQALHAYPQKGLRLTLRQALENLVPLCPTCHRLVEANPDGNTYTLEEVKAAQGL